MKITITRITILNQHHGTDVVWLHTGLPEGQWPFTGKLDLQFFVAKGDAEGYVARHFPGVPVTIVKGDS